MGFPIRKNAFAIRKNPIRPSAGPGAPIRPAASSDGPDGRARHAGSMPQGGGKDKIGGGGAFRVGARYRTGWMPFEDLPLSIEGLSLDAVYGNFVLQVAGGALSVLPGERIQDAAERHAAMDALERRIARLEGRIARERQLDRRAEMNAEAKGLRRKLRELAHGR